MMLVEEIASLYRLWTDENGAGWHTAAAPLILKQAYDKFRRFVIEQQPNVYATSVDLTISGGSYDLATETPSIMGANPSATRSQGILQVKPRNGTQVYGNYRFVHNSDQADLTNECSYWLEGSTIYLNTTSTASVRVIYIAGSLVDWTQTGPGDNEFVDDLGAYHELIAVYAAQFHGVRTGKMNPILKDLQRTLERELSRALVNYGGEKVGIVSGRT